MKWGTLGHANRKRVGWCWENKVKVAFADDMNTYTGFKVSNQNEPCDEADTIYRVGRIIYGRCVNCVSGIVIK